MIPLRNPLVRIIADRVGRDCAESRRQLSFVVTFLTVVICLCTPVALVNFVLVVFKPVGAGENDIQPLLAIGRAGLAFLISVSSLLFLYFRGLTLVFKVLFASLWSLWMLYSGIVGSPEILWHIWIIVILDGVLLLQSNKDERVLDRVSYCVLLGLAVYVVFHCLSVDGRGPDIHPFRNDSELAVLINIVNNLVPIGLNYTLVKSYTRGARLEADRNSASVKMASEVARALANFDLDEADRLMSWAGAAHDKSTVHEPLELLLRNLRSYRPFLPNYLFPHALGGDPTDGTIAGAMRDASTSWAHVASSVDRLRDPDYSLQAFTADMETAFPELALYALEVPGSGTSSGFTGQEERQRTFGALYSVYCISRLDIDGKEIFSFGVDEHGRPIANPEGESADKRRSFYSLMDWDKMLQLFLRAGLLDEVSPNKAQAAGAPLGTTISSRRTPEVSLASGSATKNLALTDAAVAIPVGARAATAVPADLRVEVNRDRMTAFLALTAIHDVMKNTALTPMVQRKHAPYHGFAEGNPISDHDLALTYVMEHFSGLLPSFNGLEPSQRVPVFFSQGKVEFNNGWLVQGEAPPGALFSTFKSVISLGGASQADISFYFAHWLTDLAGSEPYGNRPWPGAEKFSVKFPRHVLVAFLDSFSYVDHLSSASEVQVMEEYLHHRWMALGPPAQALPPGTAVAAMRVALMAQGFEAAAVAQLQELPARDIEVLASELARTGRCGQFTDAPSDVSDCPAGPALLVYYAPALIQKAGAAGVGGALRVLAAVFRAARELFPLETNMHAIERTAIVRIETLKVLAPSDIVAAGSWLLRQSSETYAVAERALPEDCDKASASVAFIQMPEL